MPAVPFFINCLVEQSVNHAAFNETKADCSPETVISMVKVLLPAPYVRQSDSHEFRERMKNVGQMCGRLGAQRNNGVLATRRGSLACNRAAKSI